MRASEHLRAGGRAAAATLGIILPAPLLAATIIPGGSGTYTLSPAPGAEPFVIPSAASRDAASGAAIEGDPAPGTGTWTITNRGTLYGAVAGILLEAAATVTNSGTIRGFTAVHVIGESATVTNRGEIDGTGTLDSPLSTGVLLSVDNAGLINNRPGGTITGIYDGAAIYGTGHSAAVVVNAGLIDAHGTAGYGVFLHATDGSVFNAAGATITGDQGGAVMRSGGPGQVDNQGLIRGLGVIEPSYGVYLQNGGSVLNGAPANPHAAIYGRSTGVRLAAPGTIVNFGSIAGGGSRSSGAYLAQGGLVDNRRGGTITGIYDGVFLGGSVAGSLRNAGYIGARGTLGYGVSVEASAPVAVTNLAGATIYGGATGVAFETGTAHRDGTVVNDGTIRGGRGGGAKASGIAFADGGTVLNGTDGVILGNVYGIRAGAVADVISYGTIRGSATTRSTGILLAGGGTVENLGSAALIAGRFRGIVVSGGAGTVINEGTITATPTAGKGAGVILEDGGVVQNGGVIYGYSGGVRITGGAGTLTNASGGTISAYSGNAVSLDRGGSLGNAGVIYGEFSGVYVAGHPGTVVNRAGGTIAGRFDSGVMLQRGGVVDNAGGIYGGHSGVSIAGSRGTVINRAGGYIQAYATGIRLGAGGIVQNAGRILAFYGQGIAATGGPATVINAAGGEIAGVSLHAVGIALAQGGSVANAGGIYGRSIGITMAGAPGTVVNQGGTIAGFALTGTSTGILLQAGGSVANLAGLISGGTGGVSIAGGVGLVVNAGTIAAPHGVAVAFAQGGGTIIDSGALIGGGGTAVALAGSDNRLVLATGAALAGAAFGGGGTNDNLVLLGSGSLAGDLTGFTSLYASGLGGGSWTLSGTVSAGNVATITQGRLAIDGRLASAQVTITATGTLGGSGTIIGNIANAGTLAPGNGLGTLTIEGNYAQSGGGFDVAVAADGQHSLLQVTGGPGQGSASLGGGTVEVLAAGEAYPVKSFTTILETSGALTGSFAGAVSEAAFLTSGLEYLPQAVVLVLTRNDVDFRRFAASDNERQVAGALNQDTLAATGELAQALNIVFALPAASRPGALDQLGGEAYSGFATAEIRGFELFADLLGQAMGASHGTGGEAGGGALLGQGPERVQLAAAPAPGQEGGAHPAGSPWSAWAGGFGATGQVSGDGNAHTLDYTSSGGAFGLDYRVRPELVIGAAFGYGHGSLSLDGLSGTGSVDTYQFALYGSYARDRWYLDGLLGYAYSSDHVRRDLGFLGTTAQGDTHADQLLAALETGYAVPLAPDTSFTPLAGLQASVLGQQGFVESGAGTLSLAVAGATTSALRSLLGGELRHQWGQVSLGLRAAWAHDYADTARPVSASFAGGGAGFAVAGARPARDSAIIGLALAVPVLERASVFLRYDGDLGGSGNAHAVTGGLRMTW